MPELTSNLHIAQQPSKGSHRQRALIFTLLLSCASIVLSGCDTTAPRPQEATTFQSGGLGLARSDWEANHRLSEEMQWATACPTYSYDVDSDTPNALMGYVVGYWEADRSPGPQAPIWAISVRWSDLMRTAGYDPQNLSTPITPEMLRQAVQSLLPADAVYERTVQGDCPEDGCPDIFYSPWLATRYESLSPDVDPWGSVTPGTFEVRHNLRTATVGIRAHLIAEPPCPTMTVPAPTQTIPTNPDPGPDTPPISTIPAGLPLPLPTTGQP